MEAERPGAAAVPTELSATDELLRQIVAHAPEGIVVTTAAGRFRLVNPAAGELLGYEQTALIGHTWRDLLLDGGEPDPSQFADAPPGPMYRRTCQVRHHDGRALTIELSTRRLADGHLLHMLYDLTARTEEEARLRASEARYRTLAEAAEDSIFLISPDETVQYVNPAGARFLDLTPEAIIGRRYAEFFPPENVAEQRARVQQVFVTGTAHTDEFVIPTPRGELWMSAALIPLPAADGAISAVLGHARDVTARKRDEEALRANEARFAAIFHASPAGICMTRQPDGLIIDANEAFAQMMGYTRAQLLSHTTRELQLWADPPVRDQLFARLRAEGHITSYELRFRRQSGALGTALIAAEMVTVGAEPYLLALLNDITAQKQAEEALRASEARFRTVVTHAQPIIFMLDREGTFLLSEGKMLASLGLAPGEVVGQSAFMLYQDYPAILHGLRTALGGVHYEDTIDVGGVIFDIFYTPYRDSAGAVSGLIGMAVDITERRHAEEALRERESQLRLANEAGDIGTWRHDLATDHIRFDARGRSHYGFDRDETTLSEVLARIHPDDLGRLKEEIATTMSPGSDGAYRTEYRVVHPDGAVHWLAVQARVYFTGEGDARRAIQGFGTSQDITARTQAAAALRESEARYRAMFEQNAAIQLLLDPSDGAIVDANPAAVRFYGYPRETLLGMRISTINQLPAAEVLAALNAALRNDHNHFHRSHRLASGEIRAVEVFAGPVMIAERQLLYAIIHDETERVRAEQALQAERASLAERVAERTAELAGALRAKDEFLANMSHELRTPLNAILGRAELLRVGIHGSLNAQQDQDLAAIDEAGQHLLALINDVLDLARIEAGRLTLERGPLQVADLCQAVLRMVAQAAVQQQLRLHTTIDPLVVMLDADARRLKQILVNLLANAVKFTPVGGEVGLEVHGNPDEQTVTFTVWDTGIGIAPEDQARLFQPFEQGSSGLSRQYGGTGLGLAVVRRLVELHGGSVVLESRPGVGSRFRVTLPWVLPGLPPSVTTRIDPPAGAPTRLGTGSDLTSTQPLILLADDNAANVAMLRDYLPTVGYRVVVAHDGMEAVTRALELRPALILMDIQMPVLDGFEAIRQIRTAGMSATPIIALTALAMPGDRERCLDAGATAYLARPVSLRTLLATIAAHLQPRGEAHSGPQEDAP